MNSPVVSLFAEQISIDKLSKNPVYLQVAHQVVEMIQRGQVAHNTPLPGTRVLAQCMGIHRNTASMIYDELAAMGWVEIIPNRGTFVSAVLPNNKLKAGTSNEDLFATETLFELKENPFLQIPFPKNTLKYTLNDGVPDVRLIPTQLLSRWLHSSAKKSQIVQSDFPVVRVSKLNNHLCNYLKTSYGFKISPDNLSVFRSVEGAFYIVAQTVLQQDDLVLVSYKNHQVVNATLRHLGAKIHQIPYDSEGISVEYIRQKFRKGEVRMVYVNAQRHYPTTVAMSFRRKIELLQLAYEYGFAIVEECFDNEWNHEHQQVSMARLDTQGAVIYIGRFGTQLLPLFHRSFVVAPNNLIEKVRHYKHIIDYRHDDFTDKILSEMLIEGDIHRIQKKILLENKRRMGHAIDLLHATFSHEIKIQKASGGMALWIEFFPHISLKTFAELLRKYDVLLPDYILFQDKSTCGIRLGFANWMEDELREIIWSFKKVYESLS